MMDVNVIMVSLSLNVSIDKINQVFSVFLNKLVINNIKRLSLTRVKASSMQKVRVTRSKLSLILFIKKQKRLRIFILWTVWCLIVKVKILVWYMYICTKYFMRDKLLCHLLLLVIIIWGVAGMNKFFCVCIWPKRFHWGDIGIDLSGRVYF